MNPKLSIIRQAHYWVLLFFPVLFSEGFAGDDQLWISADFSIYEEGPWSAKSHGQTRFDDHGDLIYSRATQYLYYQVSDRWAIGAHPQIERSRSSAQAQWRDAILLNLEANPTFTLSEKVTLKLRNRYEMAWRENDREGLRNRLRERAALSWKTSWLPGMKSITAQAELFYDLDRGRVTRYRFHPVLLQFAPSEAIRISAGLVYQESWSASRDDWNDLRALDLALLWRF